MSHTTKACRLLLCSVVVAVLCAASGAWAQRNNPAGQIRINSSPNFVGSGARALGMGGAFIAVADDATAASWNPGGLTQLERPEVSVVYSYKWLGEELAETPHLTVHDPYDVALNELNYLSVVYPIPWTIAGRNLVVSLNYQRKYEFDRELAFRARLVRALGSPSFIIAHSRFQVDFDQEGSLSSLSPAFGFELTDRLSAGVVMNIWNSSLVPGNEWESTTEQRGVTSPGLGVASIHSHDTYDDVKGINYTFGLLYKPTERLSVGAVYHTAYATDVEYTRDGRFVSTYGSFPFYYKSDIRIEWPCAMGFGVAYRFPNDKLTVSLDVTRRNWDSFVQIDPRQEWSTIVSFGQSNPRISPITGMPKRLSPHDPTYTIRLGAEYVFVNQNKAKQDFLPSLRAGVFYDPEPAGGRKDTWWAPSAFYPSLFTRGDGKPDDYYGFTLGAGLLVHNRVNLDFAYEYRWGNDVRRDTLANQGVVERGFKEDVDQHMFYLSTVIYF